MECTILKTLRIEPGVAADYRFFEPFHYRAGRPRGVTRVLMARCSATPEPTIGIAVETVPPLNAAARETLLGDRYAGLSRRDRALALNREMRTIARIVVLPAFRGIGIGLRLVEALLQSAQTPFVEAFAAMGRVHPLFERAGMDPVPLPPGPAVLRLQHALAEEGLRPIDLVDLPLDRISTALRESLRTFARRKEGPVECWLAEARHTLLSAPLYYFWRNPDVACPNLCNLRREP
jgi:GNAT superfamily N-acetyltransferase